jgi:diaminopimelate decarboxylase
MLVNYLKGKIRNRSFSLGMSEERPNRLNSAFKEWVDSQAKILSEVDLSRYVGAILSKKDLLLESAQRFGTPQYFFDEPSLVRQIAHFRNTFSKFQDRYRVFYAMKSNSFTGICKRVVAEGIGLDVSSGLELSSALDMGCDEIIFSGPGKTDEEISLAIQNRNRVTLLMDSYGEFQRVHTILKRDTPGKPAIKTGIRVRSRYHGDWNKFGISLDDLIFLLNKMQSTNGIEASGIQFHTSWNLNPGRQIRMLAEIGTYLRRHITAKGIEDLKFIDIGGGFWPEQGEWLNTENTYMGRLIKDIFPSARLRRRHFRRGAKKLDYFAREIFKAISQQGRPLTDLEVWTEPGRWISTPAMHILLQVVDVKGPRTIITDGGTNLLGWERPLTEYIPVINLSRPSLIEIDTTVFGSLCTPYDIWGKGVFGDKVKTGDILIIPDQGAYTYSLRQSFIKPRAGVITYDGESLEESKKADI